MKTINVALVGAGFMGKAHTVALANMPKLFWPAPVYPVFKTVCDIVPEIAEDAKVRFGYQNCCTDWQDVVNDPEIDLVCICTPNNAHADIAVAALEAGKHVWCEKPIAATTEEAKRMFGLTADQRAASCPSRVAKPLAKPLTGGWRSATYARSQSSAPCFSRSICSSGFMLM